MVLKSNSQEKNVDEIRTTTPKNTNNNDRSISSDR